MRQGTIAKTLVAAAMLLAAAAGTMRAETASVLLEKGIYQEQTAGDLDGAIEIYRQIIKEHAADRPIAAQALLRLANCCIKKGRNREGQSALRTLIEQFPEQKELVDQARKTLNAARMEMSEAEIAAAVEEAVTTISTCAETDPRVKPALDSLKELKQEAAVAALVEYLDSDKDTIRRSAIYILGNGGFEKIDPAVPALTKLCSHEEEYTRGMAALCLGGNKIEPSLGVLSAMALQDKSGYARRCAAYALGLLGDLRAKETLEKALKDPDRFVRNNAEAALTLLSKATRPEGAPVVVSTNPPAFATDVDPALDKITVTFDRPMMDGSWSWTGGGDTFPQTLGHPHYDDAKTTCTLPVKLQPGKVYWVGINSPSYQSFQTPDGVPARRYVILFATRSIDGKSTPLPQDLLAEAKAINTSVTATQPAIPPTKEETEAVKAAVPAAEQWLTLADKGLYDKAWDVAAGLFRNAVVKHAFTEQMKGVRTPLGAVQSRQFLSAQYTRQLPGAPDGEYVIIQFKTAFQNKSSAVETITPMKDKDETWRVSGYYIK